MKYRTRIVAGALALACLVGPVAAQNPGLAPGGSLYGNPAATQGPPAYTRTPILGVPGSVLGQIGFANTTSGTVTLRPQTGALGSSILTLPATTGTLATTTSPAASIVVGTTAVTSGTSTGVLFNNGGVLGNTAAGSAGNILTANGASNPTFQSPATVFDTIFCNTVGYIIVRLTGTWTCAQGIPVNPKWFGATGDVLTNPVTETAAIQAAITAAAGNPVLFPVGRYPVTCAGAGCDIFSSAIPINIQGAGTGSGPGSGAQSNANVTQFFISCSNCNLFSVTSVFPSTFRDFQVNVHGSNRPHTGKGIYLAGTGSGTVGNYRIANVGFTNVGTPIRVLRPFMGMIDSVYADNWNDSAIFLETSAGIEAGGGTIRNVVLFGNISTTTPPIYSEIGYTTIQGGVILGGPAAIDFNIKNYDAGHIVITGSPAIENFAVAGIRVRRGDATSASSMIQIQSAEFSEINQTADASILIAEDTTTPGWIKDIQIQGVVSRNNMKAGASHFYIQAGQNVSISGNIIEELGVNNPTGIKVSGPTTSAGIASPFGVIDNIISGTTNRYSFAAGATNPSVMLEDPFGMTFASLPANVKDGTRVWCTNCTPGSNPLASSGVTTGTWGFVENNLWVSRSGLPAQTANTVLANPTGSSAVPVAHAVPSCSTASSALNWTSNTGFGCNSSITAASVALGGITGLGTGVATALAANVGAAGAPVVFNGALGTPSSGTATNLTGLPISTGLTGAGTGVLTALGVNVGSAGAFVTFNGALGTPSSATLSNATGLPVATGISGLGTNVATRLGGAVDAASGGFPSYTAGTWSPAITASGTPGTPAYTTQVGSYETIGRQTTARITLVLSGWTGSPAGNTSISLPLTSANVTGDFGGCYSPGYAVTGLAASNFGIGATISPNTSTVALISFGSTGVTNVTAAHLGTTPVIQLICNYRTS